MDLRGLAENYVVLAGGFGQPVALSRLGVPRAELERSLSAWEDDYQLSRHFELLPVSGDPSNNFGVPETYQVNGQSYTAIIMKESVRDVLS
jgi:hypothetical protein